MLPRGFATPRFECPRARSICKGVSRMDSSGLMSWTRRPYGTGSTAAHSGSCADERCPSASQPRLIE